MQEQKTWRPGFILHGSEGAVPPEGGSGGGKRRRNTKTLWPFCPPHLEKGRRVTFRTPSDLSPADLLGEQFDLDDSIRLTASVHVQMQIHTSGDG